MRTPQRPEILNNKSGYRFLYSDARDRSANSVTKTHTEELIPIEVDYVRGKYISSRGIRGRCV